MNRYRLVHTTEFLYDGPVSESYNEVRLRPIHDEKQSCLSFRLTTTPSSRGTAYRDAYGNWVHQFNVLAEHRRLKVEAESVVLTHEAVEITGGADNARRIRLRIATRWTKNISISSLRDGYVPHLTTSSQSIKAAEEASDGTVDGIRAGRLGSDSSSAFSYVKGATHVHSSIEDSLSSRARASARISRTCCWEWCGCAGFPARYVSGYLVPGDDSGADSKQEEVIGGQASHAWAEVLMPEQGWIGF